MYFSRGKKWERTDDRRFPPLRFYQNIFCEGEGRRMYGEGGEGIFFSPSFPFFSSAYSVTQGREKEEGREKFGKLMGVVLYEEMPPEKSCNGDFLTLLS